MNKVFLDKYYTDHEVAKKCVKIVKETICQQDIKTILEPSAGNGSFILPLIESFDPSIVPINFIDIAPENDQVLCADYLNSEISYQVGRLVIGNPPFGNRGNLMQKFFKRSVQIADYIAFILPINQLNNTSSLYEFDLVKSVDLGVEKYSDRMLHCCFNVYSRPNGGLNKKIKKSIENLRVVEYRRDKNDSYRSKIKDGHFHSICTWGNSSIGKTPKFVGEFSMEVYFYSDNEKIMSLVKGINWTEEGKSISAKKLTKSRIIEIIENRLQLS